MILVRVGGIWFRVIGTFWNRKLVMKTCANTAKLYTTLLIHSFLPTILSQVFYLPLKMCTLNQRLQQKSNVVCYNEICLSNPCERK